MNEGKITENIYILKKHSENTGQSKERYSNGENKESKENRASQIARKKKLKG